MGAVSPDRSPEAPWAWSPWQRISEKGLERCPSCRSKWPKSAASSQLSGDRTRWIPRPFCYSLSWLATCNRFGWFLADLVWFLLSWMSEKVEGIIERQKTWLQSCCVAVGWDTSAEKHHLTIKHDETWKKKCPLFQFEFPNFKKGLSISEDISSWETIQLDSYGNSMDKSMKQKLYGFSSVSICFHMFPYFCPKVFPCWRCFPMPFEVPPAPRLAVAACPDVTWRCHACYLKANERHHFKPRLVWLRPLYAFMFSIFWATLLGLFFRDFRVHMIFLERNVSLMLETAKKNADTSPHEHLASRGAMILGNNDYKIL